MRNRCELPTTCPCLETAGLVLNNTPSFDCCGVPPESLASYAQHLDEVVGTLLPLVTGTDALDEATKARTRPPRTAGRLDIMPTTVSSGLSLTVLDHCPELGTGLQAMR